MSMVEPPVPGALGPRSDGDVPADALAPRLEKLAAEVRTALEALGLDDLTEALDARLIPEGRPTASIVVVGETKRGKSALVNALLERPGLSPVDFDVATNCYIGIGYGSPPRARVFRTGVPEPTEIGLDEVAEWATVAGNPGNFKHVQAVEVELDEPRLQGLHLIDTPGVGGLDAAHGALTLEALRDADALLFVVDTDGPMTRPQLDFLTGAAQRIDTVIVALTKIDAHPDWELLLQDTAQALREHAPRFAGAPIIPVSSRWLERSLSTEGERGRRLRADSGIPALHAELATRVVERAALLRLANLSRACVDALGRIDSALQQRLQALDGEPSFQADLQEKESALRRREDELAEWQDAVDDEIALLRLAHTRKLTEAVSALQQEYVTRARSVKRASDEDQLASDLQQALAAVGLRLAHETAERLAQALSETLGATGPAELLREVGEAQRRLNPFEHEPQSFDLMTVAGGFLLGTRIPSLIALVGLSTPAAPVVAVFGVGWAVFSVRSRSRSAGQAALAAWVRAELNEAEMAIRSDFSERMVAVTSQIRKLTRGEIRTRREQLRDAEREYRESVAADAATRTQRRRELTGQQLRIRGLLTDAHTLQATLTGTVSDPAGRQPPR